MIGGVGRYWGGVGMRTWFGGNWNEFPNTGVPGRVRVGATD